MCQNIFSKYKLILIYLNILSKIDQKIDYNLKL